MKIEYCQFCKILFAFLSIDNKSRLEFSHQYFELASYQTYFKFTGPADILTSPSPKQTRAGSYRRSENNKEV